MNCVIPGNNIKFMHKALLALGKLSDELYIECKPNSLQFVTMNMSKTVYAKFNFLSVFFINYNVTNPQSQDSNRGDSQLTCKVHTKAMQNIFRPKMDRNVDTLMMEIDRKGTKLDFELKYKTNVKISHTIKLLDFEYVVFEYSIDDTHNNISASGQFFTQVLSNFNAVDLNLHVEITKRKITYRNYDASSDSVYKGMRTAIGLNASEFIIYRVKEETNFLMTLKAFKNVVQFCENFNLDLDIYYKVNTSHVIVVCKNTTFEVDFVISTDSDDPEITQSTNRTNHQNNMTLEDRQVIENVNWENEFSESEKESNNSISKLVNKVIEEDLLSNNDEDVIRGSPEPEPRKKIAKLFQRCFDPTFHTSMLDFGNVLAEDSDTDP